MREPLIPTAPATIPVVLFAYARPDHLLRTIECLRANRVPLIYAFSDGPKTPEQQGRVQDVRRILRAIDWCHISVTERDTNLGLGRSIRAGVSEVLARHESAIVFEDDLICVDGTYEYLTAALRHYADDPRVMSVTGWTHKRVTPSDVTDQPYFDGRAECLVWGTWRRAWHGMDEDAATLLRRCERRGTDSSAYGADLVQMAALEHDLNIWAVRFLYLHILNGGLCLRPPHSLVEHIGTGPEATNACDASEWSNTALHRCPPVPSVWPPPVEHPDCRRLWASASVAGSSRPALSVQLREILRDVTPDPLLRVFRYLRARKARRNCRC